MTNDLEKKFVIQEGYVHKGRVLGNPTTPRPSDTIQGMGGGSKMSTGNTSEDRGESVQGNNNNSDKNEPVKE